MSAAKPTNSEKALLSIAPLTGLRHYYEFGPFQFDSGAHQLFRKGRLIHLNARAANTLLALLSNAGRMITRKELLQSVWGKTSVGQNVLDQNIAALRRALGDSARQPVYIKAIPKTGYMFVAYVKERIQGGAQISVGRRGGRSTKARPFRKEDRTRVLYQEGVSRLHRFEFCTAVDCLEQVTTTEPEFALGHAALAQALFGLGHERRAREVAKTAALLAHGLGRANELLVAAAVQEISRDYNAAAEVYGRLWEIHPDENNYGIKVAEMSAANTRSSKALETINTLRGRVLSNVEEARLGLVEAGAAELVGDFQRELTCAERTAISAMKHGNGLIVARARLQQAWASNSMGNSANALAMALEARTIGTAFGDRNIVARSLKITADVLSDLGRYAEANESYRQGLSIFRELGNPVGETVTLNNLAISIAELGDISKAKKLFTESAEISRSCGYAAGIGLARNALAGFAWRSGDLIGAECNYKSAVKAFRELQDNNKAAIALSNLGNVYLDLGRLPDARNALEESLAVHRSLGAQADVARVQNNLGFVFLHLGPLSDAESAFNEALALANLVHSNHTAAYALFGLGEIYLLRGDIKKAGELHQEALLVRERLDERVLAAESRVAVATLLMEEKNAAKAEALARRAIEVFEPEEARDNEILARAVLARSLKSQGKVSQARSEIETAMRLCAKYGGFAGRINVQRIHAKMLVAEANLGKVRRILRRALKDAKGAGYVFLELEARWDLVELESVFRPPSKMLPVLERLEADAEAKGLGLVAEKVRRLKEQSSSLASGNRINLVRI